MSRLDKCFKGLEGAKQKALIPFITAGDPDADFTLSCMHNMVKAGASIIELGVPFSDPMADGPVIQQASERALAKGMSLKGVIEIVRAFRETDQVTPVILMGYLNPIEFMGYETFASTAAKAGVDGVLTVDIPPEESSDLIAAYKQHGLAPIFLLSPTSNESRIKKVSAVAQGYIYYVSLKGVTGAGHLQLDDIKTKIQNIKQYTSLPIAIGFGVKNADIAANIAKIGDAVVVGSALINCITDHSENQSKGQQAISGLLSEMRTAMDAVTK
ncbi:tryptophan synthase subunit alpha [Cycloclasticus sp.]|jgi:tryptophan synthase alpha chain|uniref:tryptophan synthase subunit alpha n=1 Tax=Cycloclasticus sp. TaxID=2024830 RepID=UPI000C0CD269|nr:tryptophan synthase subunit alpha [Cycloclasticus sp.]PHR47816.1 MAG: tryptophan synthase subunit alpha [Cycloclasticus sp.]